MTGSIHTALSQQPQKQFSADVAMHIWHEISRALSRIHAMGVMHRDLHGGNVLLNHSAASQESLTISAIRQVKVADFGKAVDLRHLTTGRHRAEFAYTLKTAATAVTAPEIVFAPGTVWVNSRKRQAPGQLEIDLWQSGDQPYKCNYDEKIDVWASGMLLIMMMKGTDACHVPFRKDAGSRMVSLFGKIPQSVVDEFHWSVPRPWVSTTSITASSHLGNWRPAICEGFTFPSGSLLWQEKVDVALKSLAYSPKLRANSVRTAVTLGPKWV